jgi:AcrR family transcriptional regulator
MSEDVKTRILDAAKRLFAQKGFEATSVRQICEEAGANVALVSYHFGGKEKLLYAIFDRVFSREDLYAEIDAIKDPVERLSRLVEGFLHFAHQEKEVLAILMHEILRKTDRHNALGRYPLPLWRRIRQTLIEGREQGCFEFHSLKSAMLQTMGVLIYPNHVPEFVLALFDRQEQPLHERVEEAKRYILRGLGANPTESKRGNR